MRKNNLFKKFVKIFCLKSTQKMMSKKCVKIMYRKFAKNDV